MDAVPAETVTPDRLDPARVAALWATLGQPGPPPGQGDPLPPFAHHVYFWDPAPPDGLGPDGHTAPGTGLIPDTGLPRRMWAGGRVVWHAPLLAGIRAERRSRVQALTRKEGRTGALAFVTVRHEIRQRGALALTEDQELVYRPPDAVPARAPERPAIPEARKSAAFDTTTLFRYSALTFNGHRIHYDPDYARDGEGYPGLVVHGPLLAQHLMLWAAERRGPLSRFAFRATAPLCLPERATLCAAGRLFWVEGRDGRVCMTGEAE